jgi:hypothetical protein
MDKLYPQIRSKDGRRLAQIGGWINIQAGFSGIFKTWPARMRLGSAPIAAWLAV